MYSDLGNQSQVYELQLKLGEIQQDQKMLQGTLIFSSAYGRILICIMTEWTSPDDCNYNKRMVEKDRVYKFLTGLNGEFDEVRGRLIGHVPLPSHEVFFEVRREENR